MTLTQLEYVLAVNKYRHFVTAAEKCFVTQPTLSMQIHKLEEELGVLIFDRSKQPVALTNEGLKIVEQAGKIIREAELLHELVNHQKGIIEGELAVGIIPTVAPYLLPMFISEFLKNYPKVILKVEELTTDSIIRKLKNDELDAGILATPLNQVMLSEDVLYYEPFVAYISKDNSLKKLKQINSLDIKDKNIYLMQEGHCMRSQTVALCSAESNKGNFIYESGSVETLKKMVETNGGITFLPELSVFDMPVNKLKNVRYFRKPEPVREISIITHRNYTKQKLISLLKESILMSIPKKFLSAKNKEVYPVNTEDLKKINVNGH